MPSLMDKEKKSVIIGGIIGSIVGLFLLAIAAVAVPSVSASNNNCIDIDCLNQKLERICKEGTAPPYLDCENILQCMNGEEQEIMKCILFNGIYRKLF